ncbi:glycosyltransferase family 2 protein [Rothia sp. 32237D007AR]
MNTINIPKYKAAVIIPTRGGADKLHYPLDSLSQQTEKDFQVIVVVDGDVDGSAQIVQKYIDSEKLNLELIVFDENQGRVSALNAGYNAADAEILIRCDDDIEVKPDYIANHLSYHQGDSEIGVMGLVHNKFPDTPHARAYGYYRDRKFREEAYNASKDQVWHYWAANCSMRATTFKKVGGYDQRYRRYGWEDVDMGYTLYMADVELILAPELEVDHYIAATTTAGRARRALHSGASRQIFIEKHGKHVLSEPNPKGIWGVCVRLLAAISTEKNIQWFGALIDSVADKFPPHIAEKFMALIIESASFAGVKYPNRARVVF